MYNPIRPSDMKGVSCEPNVKVEFRNFKENKCF